MVTTRNYILYWVTMVQNLFADGHRATIGSCINQLLQLLGRSASGLLLGHSMCHCACHEAGARGGWD
jgi:hypothetical protein